MGLLEWFRVALLGDPDPVPKVCTLATPDQWYEIIDGGSAIKFHPCGTISHNLKDVEYGYCARCHLYIQPGDQGHGEKGKG